MITLTEQAVAEVKKVLGEQNMSLDEYGLKIGVQGGGCAGFSYSLGFDKKETFDDKFLTKEYDGIVVGVDKKSDLFLDGTVIDFYTGIDRRGFTFNNPQAVKNCGCGSSFTC